MFGFGYLKFATPIFIGRWEVRGRLKVTDKNRRSPNSKLCGWTGEAGLKMTVFVSSLSICGQHYAVRADWNFNTASVRERTCSLL